MRNVLGCCMGHEPVLLRYARGLQAGKLTLPFVYSDEVWTGIEYQCAASHLIAEGIRQSEGLIIVKAMRMLMTGGFAIPGMNMSVATTTARAMASYALLGAMAGFRYSAVERTLWFGPRLSTRPFRTFFSTASGFGTIELGDRSLRVQLLEGRLSLERKPVLTDGAQSLVLGMENHDRARHSRDQEHLNVADA